MLIAIPPTPEMAAAVEDSLETVEEMNRAAVQAATLSPRSDACIAASEYAAELGSRVQLRAERDGLDLAELLDRATDRINLDRRHGIVAAQARIAA